MGAEQSSAALNIRSTYRTEKKDLQNIYVLGIVNGENKRQGKEDSSKVDFCIALVVGILLVVIICFAYSIGSLKGEKETLGKVLDSLSEENERLGKEKEDLQKNYGSLIRENERLGKEKEALQKNYEILKSEKESLGKEKEDLQKNYGSLKREKETLGKEKEALQKNYEILKSENETLGNEKEDLQKNYGSLKREKETLGKGASSKVGFCVAVVVGILLVVIFCCVYYIACLKRDIKRLIRENEDLQKQNDSLKREKESLVKDLEELQQDRNILKSEKDKLGKEKEDLQKNYDILKSENERLGKENEGLLEQNDSLKREKERLGKENECLLDQNETLKQEKEKVEAEKEDLQKKNDILKSENERLGKEKEDLQKQNETLKQENKTVEANFEELRSKTNMCGYALDREWKPITDACVNVTLDPDTAGLSLTVSEDGSRVRFTGERSTEWPSVLGREGFTSGMHYWEVEVGEKGYWVLGVSTHPHEKSIPEKPGEGYWLVRLVKGKTCTAVSQSVDQTLNLEKICKVWGVYLDHGGGRLSFYNAETRFHIHTLEGSFPGQVYPIFSPGSHDKGPLIIKAKVKNV